MIIVEKNATCSKMHAGGIGVNAQYASNFFNAMATNSLQFVGPDNEFSIVSHEYKCRADSVLLNNYVFRVFCLRYTLMNHPCMPLWNHALDIIAKSECVCYNYE